MVLQKRANAFVIQAGKLRIAQCYAAISREIPSSKTIKQFALWLSETVTTGRYADKWAKCAMFNFPSWNPTVDHDGRGHVMVKCTNKLYTNMQPDENDANYKLYPTVFGAYSP